MPKKGKKGGKKGKKKGGKKKGKAPANADQIIQRLLKCYDRNCFLTESRMCPKIAASLRGCMENGTVLSQVKFHRISCVFFSVLTVIQVLCILEQSEVCA